VSAAGLYDYVLAVTLLFLALQVLSARDLLTGIILFIIFGILVSLAWVQLNAPDIALVEAVIGSALTGALFLASLGQIESRESRAKEDGSRRHSLTLAAAALAVAGMLLSVITVFPHLAEGMAPLVEGSLAESGVKNPVTAVILNFRGYDTLLEIGVLYLAALAVFMLSGLRPLAFHHENRPASRVLMTLLHILIPLIIVIAFYLLWAGADAPGGAFQAGAMLAGAGILMLLGGVHLPLHADSFRLRAGYVMGFTGFLAAGLGVFSLGNRFLEFPPEHAKAIIFAVELLATLSIALILLVLFAACAGFLRSARSKPRHDEERI
jgi:multisubunit Na+/H+ antiporter MnhB subunit